MPWDFWLIFLAMAVYLPWRGQRRLKKLLAMPVVGTRERFSLYVSTIAFQWVAVAVVAWRAWARGVHFQELGLAMQDGWSVAGAAIAGTAMFSLLQWFNLKRVGRLPLASRGFVQALAERILPHTTTEFIPFLALATTAGLCEEFLFRGFAVCALTRVGIPTWGVVVVSSVLFGLGHLYQGRGGVVSTSILGIMFGISKIAYDTLAVVVVWHVAVDVMASLAGYHFLVKPTLSAPSSAVTAGEK